MSTEFSDVPDSLLYSESSDIMPRVIVAVRIGRLIKITMIGRGLLHHRNTDPKAKVLLASI